MSLAVKMSEVARECAYVQKTGHNAFHKYNYATAAAVLEKVNEALATRKIATFPSFSLVDLRTIATKQGEALHAIVKVSIAIVDGESGETFTIEGLGSGADNGDKAVMKANTAATKYAYMVALNIATGDDPEADESIDHATSSQAVTVTAPKRDEPAKTPQKAASPLDSSLTFKFGPAKGVPVSDMGLQHLSYYIAAAERSLEDPAKAQWRASTAKQLAALKAEWRARDAATPKHDTDPDDNIPY